MKIKIGTQLDDGVYRELKMAAVAERRAVGDLIESAVRNYLTRKRHASGQRSGLRRFLDSPAFRLTDEQFRETMEADYYDQ